MSNNINTNDSTKLETYETSLNAVLKDWKNIEHVQYSSLSKNQYFELCVLAINQHFSAFKLIKEQTYEICEFAVKQSGYQIEDVKLQTPELCLIAVTSSGLALSRCKFQTPEICLAAVKNTGIVLSSVNESFMTFELCLVAVTNYGVSLRHIPKSVFNTFSQEQITELHMKAIQSNSWDYPLRYVDPKTPEICIEALKMNIRSLKYVPANIKKIIGDQKITELTIDAIKKNHTIFRDIENQTFEICLAAVRIFGSLLSDINHDTLLSFTIEQTYELYMEAIKHDLHGYVFLLDRELVRFSKEQQYYLTLELVKRNGNRLPKDEKLKKYSKEQIYELHMAAVKNNGITLSKIKEQTPELCVEAVKQNYNSLTDISVDVVGALDEKQKFELINIAYTQCIENIESTKDKLLKNLFERLNKFDNKVGLQVKITDVSTNKKTYKLLNCELLDFIKEQNSTAIIINDTNDAMNEGLYILKINDECYELLKTTKIIEITKGWLYNGTKKVNDTRRISIYKKTMY